MEELANREDWSFSTICWYAVFIWFGASLFSQSLYMARNGTPYEANQLLDSIGPYAWAIIGIEFVVWAFVAFAIGRKVVIASRFIPMKSQLQTKLHHRLEEASV